MPSDLFTPLALPCGLTLPNRFVLAPLTNLQSHPDGRLSDDEFRWLTLRAQGGFGLTMTCAAHVQRVGQGFPGQLGIWSDDHLEGLTRLAGAIKAAGSLAFVQLHHAGLRAPVALTGEAPVGPSEDAETGARALSGAEVEALTEDFIAAAVRAEKAGFDGVEIHGAHGYILCAFLSPAFNRREDAWGGSPTRRAKIVFDILAGARARCRPGFGLGLRLSPERFGLRLAEIRDVAAQAMQGGVGLDFLDMSLWDVRKEPEEEAFKGSSLMSYFTGLERGAVALGAAGKIRTAEEARRVLDEGCDFAVIGRAAILHHDYPRKVRADAGFEPARLPVTAEHLRAEGLSETFVDYMRTWKGFVAEPEGVEG